MLEVLTGPACLFERVRSDLQVVEGSAADDREKLRGRPGVGRRADVLRCASADRLDATLTRGRRLAGDTGVGPSPAELAQYISTVSEGLSVRAATGAGREDLHRIVAMALRAL